MPFFGTVINFFAVAVFGLLGTLFKKGIPKRISDAIMSAMAICVVYIGVDGALSSPPEVSSDSLLNAGLFKALVIILSMGIGTLIGEILDIDRAVNRFGSYLENNFTRTEAIEEGKKGNFAKGFVSCSLLFCVGAMAVTGSFEDAMGNHDIILAKTVIDSISCFVMASTLGIGCVFAAFAVLIYQGALTAIGLFAVSFIPSEIISYMSATGSLIIILIGTNMLGATKVKTANMIPAIFMPAALCPLFNLIF